MIVSRTVDHLFGNNSIAEADEFCNEVISQNPTRVFLNALWEAHRFQSVIAYVDDVMYRHGIPTTWLLNAFVFPNSGWNNLLCPTVLFDFFSWRVYNEIIVKQKSPVNAAWNPNANRYLFLTGKPDKPNRIRLLYKLEQANLLERCDYSFFMNNGMTPRSKEQLPELSDQEFTSFIDRHAGKSPDSAQVVMQQYSLHYGGIPYDPAIYTNSVVKVVAESNMTFSPAFLTEKTWLSVVNKSPFIIAGDTHSCSYLESLGFYTFDKMFGIPTYDNVPDHEHRLDKVVDHVKQWLSGNFDKQLVHDMVEHNFQQFVKINQETKQQFESTVGCNIDQAVNTRDDMTKF